MSNRYIILGCGHSGTTVVSGLLYYNGWDMLSIPSFTYEDYYLNRLNEKILYEPNEYFIEKNIKFYLDKLNKKTKGKWVLKDPLLSYLIDYYDMFIENSYRIVYIIRKPGKVIDHLCRELNMYIDSESVLDVRQLAINQYIKSNQSIINFLMEADQEYIVVKYENLLDFSDIDLLERFIEEPINCSFIDKKLNKSENIPVNKEVKDIYNRMLDIKSKNNEYIKSNYKKLDKNTNHFNSLSYIIKKLKTKIGRKINRIINRNRPTYLRKPYLEL